MSDLRDELERYRRAFVPDAGGFERLDRRRRRRRIARKAAVVATAVCVAAAGLSLAVSALRPRGVARHAASTLDASTAHTLALAWRGTMSADGEWSTVVRGERVLVSAPHETLAVFAASCPRTRCEPVASAAGLVAGGRVFGPPAVVGDVAYVAQNQVAAFAVNCSTGIASCAPLWVSSTKLDGWMTAPIVLDDRVVVGTSDGRLLAFATHCGSKICRPLVSARIGTAPIEFPLVADRRDLLVVSDRLYEVPASCILGGRCRTRWSASVGTIPNPVAAEGGVVFDSYGNHLRAFGTSCGSGGTVCTPAWAFTAPATSSLSPPAVAHGTVYVGGDRLFAFPADCRPTDGACTPTWTGPLRAPSATVAPVVGRGLVAVVAGDRVEMFAQICRTPSRICPPLWTSRPLENGLSGLAIGPHGIFVVGDSGTLYAFRVS
jgi:hypothetical protein